MGMISYLFQVTPSTKKMSIKALEVLVPSAPSSQVTLIVIIDEPNPMTVDFTISVLLAAMVPISTIFSPPNSIIPYATEIFAVTLVAGPPPILLIDADIPNPPDISISK